MRRILTPLSVPLAVDMRIRSPPESGCSPGQRSTGTRRADSFGSLNGMVMVTMPWS